MTHITFGAMCRYPRSTARIARNSMTMYSFLPNLQRVSGLSAASFAFAWHTDLRAETDRGIHISDDAQKDTARIDLEVS